MTSLLSDSQIAKALARQGVKDNRAKYAVDHPPTPARIANPMNKTESSRSLELQAEKRAGMIKDWWFGRWTWKLGDDCRYTPDFVILENDGSLRVEEIKGLMRDDALVKLKTFATMFPFLPISVLRKRKGGGWDITQIKSLP